MPVQPDADERRTVSVDRRRNISKSFRDSTTAIAAPRLSAPELLPTADPIDTVQPESKLSRAPSRASQTPTHHEAQKQVEASGEEEPSAVDTRSISTEAFDELIQEELEKRWILNLSMHFRDKSKREKFFVTFAETPTHWRRVTISLDYRDAPEGSLEEELQRTRFQRDKSSRIYEAIRESLPDIQFYDTVTNLKLQTENERLHVHVVEDLSEIIQYPPVRSINHLNCRRVREEDLVFDSHLSGFVYKVTVRGQVFIKKEIPGPDTVDEFLYEINALHQLSGSRSVIQFGGVVLDNKGETVKGLLISFAEQGALIDVIYDGEGRIPWGRRERWARQIVQGLSEIHEAGFVQGDFTLSNIVIDADDNAKIIDINRRGCPVGWEPPEVAALIDSNQRISMYIGVKSDLFQLGMVLFALAIQQDEPENHRPFDLASLPTEIPDYFVDICLRCLSDDPRRRSQAATLLTLFPHIEENYATNGGSATGGLIPIVVDACYPDEDPRSPYENRNPFERKNSNPHFTQNPGLETPINVYDYAVTDTSEEPESEYFPRRGRSPPASFRHEAVPSEIPLPRSSSGSSYQDINFLETPSANNTLNFSALASLEDYQQGPEDTKDPFILAIDASQETAVPTKLPDATSFVEPRQWAMPELPSTPESMKPQNVPLPDSPGETEFGNPQESATPEAPPPATKLEPLQDQSIPPVLRSDGPSEEGQTSSCPDPKIEAEKSQIIAILSDLPDAKIPRDLPKDAEPSSHCATQIGQSAHASPSPNNLQAQALPQAARAPSLHAASVSEKPANPAELTENVMTTGASADTSHLVTGPEKTTTAIPPALEKTTPEEPQSGLMHETFASLPLTGLQKKPGYAAISSDLSNTVNKGTRAEDSCDTAPPSRISNGFHSAPTPKPQPLPTRRPPTPPTQARSNGSIITSGEMEGERGQQQTVAFPPCSRIGQNWGELAGIGMGMGMGQVNGGQFGCLPASLDDEFITGIAVMGYDGDDNNHDRKGLGAEAGETSTGSA